MMRLKILVTIRMTYPDYDDAVSFPVLEQGNG
jgi:hypothetical protein